MGMFWFYLAIVISIYQAVVYQKKSN